MNVYRDTNATVTFTHPFPGPLTATVYNDGDTTTPLRSATDLMPTAGVYSVDGLVTYRETEYDGRLRIDWTGTEGDGSAFSRSTYLDVVTPLLNTVQLQDVFVDSGEVPTDAELSELEATVRSIINTYCRQDFGYAVGTKTFVGDGSKRIALKQRCARLDQFAGGWFGDGTATVNGQEVILTPADRGVTLSGDGWTINLDPNLSLTVKESPPIEFLNYVSNGVIQVPDFYVRAFNTGATFTATGVWGYEVVPDEVQQAATLLVNDYASLDVSYRDRYLESVKIQQDTWIYHPGAFRGTGNARADLLLGKWRRNGMVII